MKKSFVKKIAVVLLILFLLAVAISVSPILPYFQSLGAELDTSDSAALTDTAALTTAPTTSAGEENPVPNTDAILFAVVLSGATIVVAAVVFIKKHNPDA